MAYSLTTITKPFKNLTLTDMGNYYECTHKNGKRMLFAYDGTLQDMVADPWFKGRLAHFDEHGTMEGY